MAGQEDIKHELDETIRVARIGADSARTLLITILESGRSINGFHLATYISAQAEALIGAWTTEALAKKKATPEGALAEVRQKVSDAIFKGARTDDPMEKAINEHRKAVYAQFLKFTEHLAAGSAPEDQRAASKYRADIAAKSVRRRYKSAVRAGQPALKVAHAETLFVLATGYERHEATDEAFASFVGELNAAIQKELAEEGKS